MRTKSAGSEHATLTAVDNDRELGVMVQVSGDDLARIGAALFAANDLVYEWDLTTDRVTWHGNVADVLHMGMEDVPGTSGQFKGRVNPQDLPQRLLALSEHLTAGRSYDCEYRIRLGDGSFCWVHDRGSASFNDNGTPMRFTGVLRVIDRRKQHEARLEMLASYDELTGFYNRKRLRTSLEETLAQSARYGDPGAFVTVQIDRLDVVNEGFGYAAVDTVLAAAGQRLESVIRASDVIGRVGEDQFGIVLTRCPEPSLRTVVEKIQSTFRDAPLATAFGDFPLTVSVGAVTFPAYSMLAAELMTKAELALQKARLRGADRWEAYSWSDSKRDGYRSHMSVGDQVMQAMKQQRLVFAYQPIVVADSEEVAYYEALLRMVEVSGQIIAAGQFMPAVEEMGLHRLVDRYCLDMAVRDLQRRDGLRLAINISSLTLSDRTYLRRLVALLRHRPDLADRLTVEITETAAMHDIDDSLRFVTTARDLGCHIAIDDFGAGYTSLRQLRSLPIDVLKIDGSFIRNLDSCQNNQVFVRTLLELAANFGFATVAEFVETEAEAAVLRDLGVGYMQGYLFGRPEIAADAQAAVPPPSSLPPALPMDVAQASGG